jgi:hypothetical protein
MNHPTDNLTESLRRWRVAPPADPNFRPQVWQRIRDRSRVTWPSYLRAHSAAWSLATVLALGAAAYTGHVAAEARTRSDREALVVTYLVELDPRVQALLKPGAP